MLSDFLSLENLYGHEGVALYFEDVIRRYDEYSLQEAIEEGFIFTRRIYLGPDTGRYIFWLSEKGREMAMGQVH